MLLKPDYNLENVYKIDFEALKKDLQEAAKLDFVENDIGPSELLHLYNQKLDKKQQK